MNQRPTALAERLLYRARMGPVVGLVCLLSTFAMTSGCFLPQDETYLETIPEARNRPPRIILSEPAAAQVSVRNGAGCQIRFQANVEDPDVDNLIRVRWFVDGVSSTEFSQNRPIVVSGKAIRDEATVLTINTSSAGNPLASPGTHLVELCVGDNELEEGNICRAKAFDTPTDGGTPQNPGFVDTRAWFVEVEQGSCPQ